MKEYQGELHMLGDASASKSMTNYSVIEIGGQVLQKIKVPGGLNNFLSKSLRQDGDTTLYLNGKVLLGIKTPEGKLYCYDAKAWKLFLIGLVIFGWPLSWLTLGSSVGAAIFSIVIFIPFYFTFFAEWNNRSISNRLKAQGAIPVEI